MPSPAPDPADTRCTDFGTDGVADFEAWWGNPDHSCGVHPVFVALLVANDREPLFQPDTLVERFSERAVNVSFGVLGRHQIAGHQTPQIHPAADELAGRYPSRSRIIGLYRLRSDVVQHREGPHVGKVSSHPPQSGGWLEYGTPPPPSPLRGTATPPRRGGVGVVGSLRLSRDTGHAQPSPPGRGRRGDAVPRRGWGLSSPADSQHAVRPAAILHPQQSHRAVTRFARFRRTLGKHGKLSGS